MKVGVRRHRPGLSKMRAANDCCCLASGRRLGFEGDGNDHCARCHRNNQEVPK